MYGSLPITGAGTLVFGGVAIRYPLLAAAGAAAVVGGLLIMRFVRPSRAHLPK